MAECEGDQERQAEEPEEPEEPEKPEQEAVSYADTMCNQVVGNVESIVEQYDGNTPLARLTLKFGLYGAVGKDCVVEMRRKREQHPKKKKVWRYVGRIHKPAARHANKFTISETDAATLLQWTPGEWLTRVKNGSARARTSARGLKPKKYFPGHVFYAH